ncbi:SWIM zinc finger family protein [Zooshikella harenae]|uniref:SWIM zinc finger family protein n=1 Tax=Zooshikella harenae TaxID=2827238 RepID=A0ABS5Z698_9GAMM|nr:SWIM zinc finger family protein [Zooshikella harenae]MBU2709568.1 SWIM zinc finger family protein [Zooshikella harenae]
MSDKAQQSLSPQNNQNAEVDMNTTSVHLTYQQVSGVHTSESQQQLSLFSALARQPVELHARLTHSAVMRSGLSALYQVVCSDLRYKPKDRAQYLAFKELQRTNQRRHILSAQQAYFNWLAENDPLAYCVLDPVVSVHPDCTTFEVFSKDESCYAQLSLAHNQLELLAPVGCGTTNVDFSDHFFQGVQQLRQYKTTEIHIGQQAVGLKTAQQGEVLAKQTHLPDSWLRGLLQIQSAMQLPGDSFKLAPIDLYNVLHFLRLNRDVKGKRRGIKIELVPNQYPKLVLEPWEKVIESSAERWTGSEPKVVRIWGRRRLQHLQAFLSHAEYISVHLLGSGLPSIWQAQGEGVGLTLVLSGFTTANWSQAARFDLLLPRHQNINTEQFDELLSCLQKQPSSLDALNTELNLSSSDTLALTQYGIQHGLISFNRVQQCFYYRPLLDQLPDSQQLRYRDDVFAEAINLINNKAVSDVKQHWLPGDTIELTAILNASSKSPISTMIQVTEEGHVSKAECSCFTFVKQGMSQGPCAHIIALRMTHFQQLQQPESDPIYERHYFTRRDAESEHVYLVQRHQQRVTLRWGKAGTSLRMQQWVFNTQQAAQSAVNEQKQRLLARGFIDATAR